MKDNFASRFLYRLIRKMSRAQAKLVNKTLKLQNKFLVNYDGLELIMPLCVSTGFDNISWNKSWKTEVIDRLVDADHGVFVDVGANVGQTLLDLLVVHPMSRYIGFEPNVACVYYLKELILANSFNRCLVIPAALTDETKCLPLYRGKGLIEDSGATIMSNVRPARSYDVDFTPCFKFDDIRQSLSVRDINFVKIDVEGSELETLTGMRKSLQDCRPLILCEVLFTDSKADLAHHRARNDALMQFLGDLNYEVLQLIKSADQAHVADARTLDHFPSAYWTLENKDLCDYLYIPKEKDADVLNTLLSARV